MSVTTNEQDVQNEITNNQREYLSDTIRKAVVNYLDALDGAEPKDVYALFLAQLEKPLLEVMLNRNRGNQSTTAKQLGLARGTIRTKMKQYDLLVDTSNA